MVFPETVTLSDPVATEIPTTISELAFEMFPTVLFEIVAPFTP